MFDEAFIEERRRGLEQFLNKCVCAARARRDGRRVAGHPLAQNELALHMFLQEPAINKNYTPGKVRAK